MLRLYRGIGPGTILLIIISMGLIWLQPLLNPVEPSMFHDNNPAPLYSILLGFFKDSPRGAVIFSMVLILVISVYLVNFNTRLFFINERTFLPASLYVILSGFMKSMQVLNPVLPASLLLLIAIDRLLVSYRKPGVAYNLFDASLFIGIAALIYTNIIWFYIVIVSGIIIFRSFNLRELMISIFGLLLPFIILYAVYYLTGRDLMMLNDFFIESIITEVSDYYWSPELIVVSALNALIFILALLKLSGVFNTKKIRSRKIFSLLTWVLVVSIAAYFAVPSVSVEMMYVFLVPLVYFLTHYLVVMRNKKIANYVFAIILFSVVFIQLS